PTSPTASPTAPRGVSPVVAKPSLAAEPAAATPAAEPATPAPDTPPLREHLSPVVAEPETRDCPYCSQSLPTDRSLKYCPHCGLNLRIRRCPGCSAEMEAEWKFCVTCGRAAP
ncbi:MAG TPA: zinc ribbon domain-containing protein, partial [Gemmatimonadaceae bacterium]|nr:zinc ribbon domain-containing protein [Gemmatimonadaceae bacterium]